MLDFMRRQRSALKWVWVILIFIFSVTLITLYIPFGDLPNVSVTNDVANEILADKLRSFVAGAVLVTNKEAEEEYKRRNEKAKIDYFIVDATKLEDKVSASDKDLHDYYDKNKTKYTVNEKRKAKYIFLSSLKLRSKVTVSDDELRQYFEQHKNEYILPERIKAQHILFKTPGKSPEEIEKINEKARQVLDRAKKGEDFGSLAK